MGPLQPEELGLLYRRHAPALRLFARQWPGGDDDLVQEAFLRLAQQNPAPERVIAWLYRVVRNAALSSRRAGSRRRRREGVVSAPEAWFSPDDDRLDGREAARRLAELPLEIREIIVARVWGGLTFDVVAQLVGCSIATVHRRYQAGLAELRRRLEDRWTTMPNN